MNSSEADLVAANREYQEDEMLALGAILDSNTFVTNSTQNSTDAETCTLSGSLVINLVTPTAGITIQKGDERAVVKYLPPLRLHFTLPSNYPLEAKPTFTISASWLNRAKLSKLCQKLDSLWEENKELNAILFLWYSFIREETFTELDIEHYDVSWWKPFYSQSSSSSAAGDQHTRKRHKSNSKINSTDDSKTEDQISTTEDLSPVPKSIKTITAKKTDYHLDPRAVVDYKPMPSLLNYLKSFNEEQIEIEFTLYSHSCSICFNDTIGTECFKFPVCAHIYCKKCVKEYFETLIKDGSIDNVTCPAFKCKSTPTPGQILSVVGPELYERYDRLLLQRTLDSMSDVLYCPRLRCHQHVLYDPNDKLATCCACGYAFCAACKMVYHGVEPCRFKANDKVKIYEKYTSGTAEDKKKLEKKYGKKQLALLVESVLSENWVNKKAKPCPHCSAPIEKFEGCNKVTCFKCNTYFCWVCLKQLSSTNPYFHFNDPASPCFNTLFEGVNLDDEDDSDSDDEFLDLSDDEDDDEWGD